MNVQKRLSLVEHKLNDRRQDWKLDVLSAIVLANSCLVGPGMYYSIHDDGDDDNDDILNNILYHR